MGNMCSNPFERRRSNDQHGSDNRGDNSRSSSTERQSRLVDHASRPPESSGVQPSPRLQQLRREGGGIGTPESENLISGAGAPPFNRSSEIVRLEANTQTKASSLTTTPAGIESNFLPDTSRSDFQPGDDTSSFSSERVSAALEAIKDTRASNAWEEIKDAENQGDVNGAYSIAKNAGNYYKCNLLARDYNIPNHEYTEIIHFPGNNMIENTKKCLESRLREGATASKLGFRGFDKKTVADVGTKDGRYIPLFKDLGAKDVYGIDPDKDAMNIAIEKGLLSKEHAILTTLEEVPENLKGTFDVATVFNLDPSLARNERFIQSLRDVLPSNGQVVMTVVETETYQNVLPLMHKYFNVDSQQLWERKPGASDTPHTYLIVADQKRPSEVNLQRRDISSSSSTEKR